ncbi:MAG: beta-lactamase family protein [Desulfovibrionaceae bacterium]|nr:beta-lactamase family protein [Desulfovibrionaceae bacterium]MBF0513999.1 beta-lactamase family protein [Desulfovibrionaceae bacterium]
MNIAQCIPFFILACLALPFAPKTVWAQTSLDSLLRPYLDGSGLPAVAAAVAKNGKIVAAGAVGSRRAGADIPVTPNDRFHIGSDTKAMTALLAAMLVEEGKLRWDSTPAALFPEFASGMDAGFASVTLRQLLSHSAGLPRDNEDVAAVWKEALFQDGNLDAIRCFIVEQWSKKPLASPPGTKFEYSNMGYVVAGAMIERAAAKTWDELIVERVFTPLALTTAGLGCQATLGRVDAPLGHVLAEGKTQAVLAGLNCDNPAYLGPAGIAHLSILDFARWASWNAGEGKRGPALVRPETMRALHAPVVSLPQEAQAKSDGKNPRDGYGLGWGVVNVDFASHPLLQHGGSNNKNLAHIWVDVKNDLAIVIAANIAGEKADAALHAIARTLYAQYAAAKVH